MNRISIILSLIALIGTSVIGYRLIMWRPVVYVDLGKLQGGYKLKQQLEKQAENDLLSIKNKLDSFKMVRSIQSTGPQARVSDTVVARLEYELKRYYIAVNDDIGSKVWDRLNPAIDRYGKEHDYPVIIGANGAGNVLYGVESYDVTADLLKYINDVYEKGL